MVPSSAIKFSRFFNQVRALSGCGVLNNIKEVTFNHGYRIMTVKKATKRKTKKKHIVLKRVSDDIEAVWLENLSSSNLKLFRKTSFGSFRKINLENFFEKLKEIYPKTFGNSHSGVKTSSQENSVQPKAQLEPDGTKGPVLSDGAKAPACLSEYLIKHIMQFPLLRPKTGSSFCEFAKMEAEEFGAIDAVMFPSVTGILNETMSYAARLRLKQWKERMIAELGVDGFNKYQEDLLTQGSKFHSTLKTYLEVGDKRLVTIDPEIEGCWKSLEKLLPNITDVKFVEESIHHPVLMYKGIVDCVAAYRGTPCVIEWKKSSKPKPNLSSTYDAPVQLCAYLGALPWHKKVAVENGLVVVAYTDGTPANAFELTRESCEVYWIEWLRRVQSYWLKKSSAMVQEETHV